MYQSFYGLDEKPFNLTPDPKYLFLSDNHREAFAHLLYGIKNRSGFVMVTGEIGTGKTTICRTLLNQLDDETEVAFIFNTSLSPLELIKKINTEFGIASMGSDVQDLIDELNEYLLDATQQGKKCVLVVDEAQNLSPAVLEQVRLLSNLETETEKLLQIVLIGQPELAEKLQLHELRQLNQRITARYHLKPLTPKETEQYIGYRMHTAGARRSKYFNRGALSAIYRASRGTPRVINALCDRALLIGYTQEEPVLAKRHIAKAVHEIKGEKISTHGWNWREWIPSPSLLVAVLLVVIGVGIVREWQRTNNLIADVTQPGGESSREVAKAATRPEDAVKPVKTNAEPAPEKVASTPAPALTGGQALATKVIEIITPAPAVPAPAITGLDAALNEISAEAARTGAANVILALWNAGPITTPPQGDTPQDLAQFAAGHGFAHEDLSPALEQLVSIGLPAFVAMNTSGGTRWVALVGTEDRNMRLQFSPEKMVVSTRSEFLDHYAGQAVILWKDQAPQTPVMRQGRSGPVVAGMKGQLRQLHRIAAANTSPQYDAETAAAIAKLQAETGLDIDGMAGRQVRMVLSSWAPDSPTPSLVARAPLEPPAPAPVAAAQTAEAPAAPPTAPQLPKVGKSFSELLSEEPEVKKDPAPASENPPTPPAAEPSGELPAENPGAEAAPQPEKIEAQIEMKPLPPIDVESRKETTPPMTQGVPLSPSAPDKPAA